MYGVSEVEVRRDWAESGVLALTGWPDGSPIVPPGDAPSCARTWATWIVDCAGVDRAGVGGLDGAALLGERAAFTGRTRRGRTSVGGYARLLPTADGWAALSSARLDDAGLLGAMIGATIDGDDPWPAVEQWLSTRHGDEVRERIELLGIAGGCIRGERFEAVDSGTGCGDISRDLPAAARSLDGATVVDFSALWAGPLCAHILGAAGARVIKVETPDRPDGARLGNSDFYDLLHAGHESVVLDPNDAPQRAALAALVDSADVVIEASRPRALARFGLSADAAAARGCTWISVTAAGRSSDRIGFGDDVAAAAGLVAKDSAGAPVFVGDAIADPLTGLRAAVCALDARNASAGRVWDVSMTDVVALTMVNSETSRVRQNGVTENDADENKATESDFTDVRRPHGRTPTGRAARSGLHTASVLAGLSRASRFL